MLDFDWKIASYCEANKIVKKQYRSFIAVFLLSVRGQLVNDDISPPSLPELGLRLSDIYPC